MLNYDDFNTLYFHVMNMDQFQNITILWYNLVFMRKNIFLD